MVGRIQTGIFRHTLQTQQKSFTQPTGCHWLPRNMTIACTIKPSTCTPLITLCVIPDIPNRGKPKGIHLYTYALYHPCTPGQYWILDLNHWPADGWNIYLNRWPNCIYIKYNVCANQWPHFSYHYKIIPLLLDPTFTTIKYRYLITDLSSRLQIIF